jgi:hypothetical protein
MLDNSIYHHDCIVAATSLQNVSEKTHYQFEACHTATANDHFDSQLAGWVVETLWSTDTEPQRSSRIGGVTTPTPLRIFKKQIKIKNRRKSFEY